MHLSEYFEHAKGKGVLATADASGRVNGAVYAKPHFLDEETVAFIMAERLTRENLTTNPHAAYVFLEDGERYVGRRLHLTRIREEQDAALIEKMRRSRHGTPHESGKQEQRYLVTFRIDKVLPLVGSGE
jgi:hypothetical protein